MPRKTGNLKRIPYTHDGAKNFVKRFCDHIFWLRSIYHTYKVLFEDDESVALMNITARTFFTMLQIILRDNIFLEFSKITDPAKTGKKENFTVDNLVISIDWLYNPLYSNTKSGKV